jgi:hypothetical protein
MDKLVQTLALSFQVITTMAKATNTVGIATTTPMVRYSISQQMSLINHKGMWTVSKKLTNDS